MPDSKSEKHAQLVRKIEASYVPDERARLAISRYREAARGLLEELALAGYPVQDMRELRELGINKKVSPILIKWLSKVDYPALYSDILACFRQSKTRAALPALVDEFTRSEDIDRWTVGNAIATIAGPKDYGVLADLVCEPKYGCARQMLVMKLGAMKSNSEAADLLLSLVEDKDVALHAIIALGKLRASRAAPTIERFLDANYLDGCFGNQLGRDVKNGLRREAKKALKLMGRPLPR